MTLNVGDFCRKVSAYNICLSTDEFYDTVKSRAPDSDEFLRWASHRVQVLLEKTVFRCPFPMNEQRALLDALNIEQFDEHEDLDVNIYDKKTFLELEIVISHGFDPTHFSSRDMLYMTNPFLVYKHDSPMDDDSSTFSWSSRKGEAINWRQDFTLLLKSSYDRLRLMGFPVEAGPRLLIVDDLEQHADIVRPVLDDLYAGLD